MMSMRLISADILEPFWKLQSFTKWHKGIDMHPEDATTYTIHYPEAFLMYVENEHCGKH